MSHTEIVDTSVLLTTAGSETTATTLAATTFFLGSHPDVLEKLKAEVRSAFKSEGEIDLNSVQNLKYMLAVLKESMRVYPPVPIALARKSPPGGSQIAGKHVVGGASRNICLHYISNTNHERVDYSGRLAICSLSQPLTLYLP
jgi:hypothetical protein